MSLTISATNLGRYASDLFCERCEWVRLNTKPLPFQSFPGIFSTIDRYNKLVVHSYFDRVGTLPEWLRKLGGVESYVVPPTYSRFSTFDEETGVTLRGEADGIFRLTDDSYVIVDYKTAKYTSGQWALSSQYEAQLNAYAYIGERLQFSPVNQLALVYMEPITDEQTAGTSRIVDSEGFSMGLRATVVPVKVRPDELIPRLLAKASAISQMDNPPAISDWCKDCNAVDGLLQVLT